MKVLIFLLVSGVLSGTALNGADLQISVRVVNLEVIPDAIRLAGERMAAGILKSAGVNVAWVECEGRDPNPCRTSLGRNEFWLHLLPGKPPRSLEDSAGFAVIYPTASGKDGYAGVFYRKVLAAAASEECTPATMLGATLAHEIGHVLLGSKQHSTRGVMRPRL